MAESEQMTGLLIGLEKAACLISRCKIYEILYLRQNPPSQGAPNLELALIELYTIVLRFLAKANQLYDSFIKRQVYGVLNPNEVNKIVDECTRQEQQVEFDATNCERISSQNAHSATQKGLQECEGKLRLMLKDLKQPLQEMKFELTAIHTKLCDKEQLDSLTWASSISYEANHKVARETRTDGTGAWLLEHETFRQWRNSDGSMILWLHGIRRSFISQALFRKFLSPTNASPVGAGKTKLVTRVVDDFLDHRKHYQQLAYFYCDRNQADLQDPALILGSYVRQLSLNPHHGSVDQILVDFYQKKRNVRFASGKLDIEECRDLLSQLVQKYARTAIVLDALDECSEQSRKVLVDTLNTLVDQSKIKVFISSRLTDDIKHQFAARRNVQIEATDNREDIGKFLDDKLKNRCPAKWRNVHPDLKSDVYQTLLDQANGM